MRLADEEWPTVISTVRLGAAAYRVIRPAKPILHAVLYDGRWGMDMRVDKAAASTLAMAWGLAAGSPHSLIYLPLRSAGPMGVAVDHRRLDLVLLHHRLGFPVSRWKRVRAGLGKGALHTARLADNALPHFGADEHRRSWHREFKDYLRYDVAADTLFLIGSRHAFRLAGGQVRDLVEQCPGYVASTADGHCCAEISIGRTWRHRDRRNPPAELHIQYCVPDS